MIYIHVDPETTEIVNMNVRFLFVANYIAATKKIRKASTVYLDSIDFELITVSS